MSDDLNLERLLGAEKLAKLVRSWEAYSATNVVFNRRRQLLLGVRKQAAQSIPEPGDYALIGGFNTEVVGPATRADVANYHAFAQLGIELKAGQCSGFLECEYPPEAHATPLNLGEFGKVNIKRAAFDRFVVLTDEQDAKVVAGGAKGDKIKAVERFDERQFRELVKSGAVSFPYQVGHVLKAFQLLDMAWRNDDYSDTSYFVAGWSLNLSKRG